MSKAEMLLADMSESINEHSHLVVDTETHFVIDPITREIKVRDQRDKAIMQYDHASERFTFELPRFIEGHDMTLCNRVRVHYININGQTGESNSEPVELHDLRVDPENPTVVICSWLVTRHATQLVGALNFLVQYMCVSDMGVVDYEFHSDIYRDLPVKENPRADESSVIEYSDIIEQWRTKLFGAGDSAVAEITLNAETQLKNIETEGAEQVAAVDKTKDDAIAAITAKGEATLASIPEEYTTTHNMADRAFRTKASAIMVTAEGESVVAEDCSDDYLRGLHVCGKTTQITTTGAQLFDGTKLVKLSASGVTMTNDDLGRVTLTGSATAPFSSVNIEVKGLTPGTYTVSGQIGEKIFSYIRVTNADGSYKYHKAPISFTLDGTETEVLFYLYAPAGGVSFNNETIYPMLNAGSKALPWEPYSGGVASPSPEWAQELVSVENPIITLHGKNLIQNDIPKATNSGITYTQNDDGSITLNGTATEHSYYTFDFNHPIPVHDVELVLSIEGGGGLTAITVGYFRADGTTVNTVAYAENTSVVFKYPEEAVLTRTFLTVTQGKTCDNIIVRPMVRLATADKAFEGAKTIQTLPLNRTLSGIPVTSGGNYTDLNGQQWIADEIDFERGVYIQRIREITIDGSQAVDTDGADHNPWRKYIWINAYPALAEHGGLCDKLKHRRSVDLVVGNAIEDAGFNMSVNHNVIYFNIGHWMTEDTKEAATAALVEHPLTIKYALKNPIETPLTDEELLAFSKLHSNSLVTTVLNSENAYMGLVYNADTKAYIDGQFKALFNRLQESGNIA